MATSTYIGIITAELDIRLREGDFHKFVVPFLDDGSAYDLTAFSGTLVLEMRVSQGVGDAVETLSEAGGELVVGGVSDNELELTFAEDLTDHRGVFFYDIHGTDSEGIKTIAEGTITYTPDA